MRTKAAVIAAVAALALAPALAGTAWADGSSSLAGQNIRVRTSDADPGGEGYFHHQGDRVQACDIQADGEGAVTYAWQWKNGAWSYWGHVTDPSKGGCASKSPDFKEGIPVAIQTCLYKNGDYNRSCSKFGYGRA